MCLGMPTLFFNYKAGLEKWIMAFIAIPAWVYLEWHFSHYGVYIVLEEQIYENIRLLSDFLLLFTIS